MVHFFKLKTEKCKKVLLAFACSCVFLISFNACQSHKSAEKSAVLTNEQYRSIGEQIRKERIIKGLTQKELADAVSISQNALSLIEDGLATPIHQKIVAIEEYLGVELIRDARLASDKK